PLAEGAAHPLVERVDVQGLVGVHGTSSGVRRLTAIGRSSARHGPTARRPRRRGGRGGTGRPGTVAQRGRRRGRPAQAGGGVGRGATGRGLLASVLIETSPRSGRRASRRPPATWRH